MIPKLFIDKRVAVNGKSSHIILDNPVAVHNFVKTYLKEYAKALPVYADEAAATAAGLEAGDWYKTPAGSLQVKL